MSTHQPQIPATRSPRGQETMKPIQIIAPAILGVALLSFGAGLLRWTIGRSGAVERTLRDIEASWVEAVPELGIQPSDDARFLFLSGQVSVSELVRDEVTGLELPALVVMTRLEQTVSVTERVGEKIMHGREWQSTVRPGLEGATLRPATVRVGRFEISDDLLDDLGFGEQLACTDPRMRAPVYEGRAFACAEDGYFHAPDEVEDGNLRFGLTGIPATHLSLVALQIDGELTQVTDASGNYIRLIEPEEMDLAGILTAARRRGSSQERLGSYFATAPALLGVALLVSAWRRYRMR